MERTVDGRRLGLRGRRRSSPPGLRRRAVAKLGQSIIGGHDRIVINITTGRSSIYGDAGFVEGGRLTEGRDTLTGSNVLGDLIAGDASGVDQGIVLGEQTGSMVAAATMSFAEVSSTSA